MTMPEEQQTLPGFGITDDLKQELARVYGDTDEPDARSTEGFSIGDELNEDVAGQELSRVYGYGDEPVPDIDPEMDRVFNPQSHGEDDEEIETDWSPEAGLLPKGKARRGILANVKKQATGPRSAHPGTPALVWSVTDVETGRTVSKTVPLRDSHPRTTGRNIEFAQAIGLKVHQRDDGVWMLPPLKALRSKINTPVLFKADHFGDPLRDSLDEILPPQEIPTDVDFPPED